MLKESTSRFKLLLFLLFLRSTLSFPIIYIFV